MESEWSLSDRRGDLQDFSDSGEKCKELLIALQAFG